LRIADYRLPIAFKRPCVPAYGRTGWQRRGSALILVVTILGILFVTGVAFLTTMSFESRMLTLEQESRQAELNLKVAHDVVDEIARNAWIMTKGVPTGAQALGSMVTTPNPVYIRGVYDPPDYAAFKAAQQTYVDLPRVHGLFSQIEPYSFEDEPGNFKLVYGWYTDVKTTKSGPSAGSIYESNRFIDTALPNLSLLDLKSYRFPNDTPDPDDYQDPNPPFVADADGDGIVDSILVDMTGELGVPRAQLRELARAVNPPNFPSDKVYLALRIIPHGGLVNLAEGHPNLISNIMNRQPAAWTTGLWSERPYGYVAAAEEPSLRHRGGLLPPRMLPPTLLQGNPWDSSNQENPGGGDFASHLIIPWGNRPWPESYRYWPFRAPVPPDDANINDYLTWQDRMNPEANNNYDRRHLVTTVSYDDLLARPTQLGTPALGATDAFSAMITLNREAALRDTDAPCPEMLAFEYPNYPHSVENGPDNVDWCSCVRDSTCTLDPRKGRLRLSLPWLDQAYVAGGDTDTDPATIGDRQRIRLIQDAFSMLLLQARGAPWGAFDVNGNWLPNYPELSKTAAALTANLLDFADDDDDMPTWVDVRSLDFGNPATVGSPTGQSVFGLEKQLYITEVTASIQAVSNSDGTGTTAGPDSTYAIELFNPYGGLPIRTVLDLPNDRGYWLKIGDANPIALPSASLGLNQYMVIYSGDRTNLEPPVILGTVIQSQSSYSFNNGETIYLLRRVRLPNPTTGLLELKDVVVDQFHVGVARVPPMPDVRVLTSLERAWNPNYANSSIADPWFAPIPANPNDVKDIHSLGTRNTNAQDTQLRPVQALVANRGSFSTAFPTTGSLLWLMRYANRSIDALPGETRLAFTSYLGSEKTSVENGRMPVFDVVTTPGAVPLHHEDPATSADNQPGEVMHLPWGQLVYDYFTALPLNNPSPWANPPPGFIDPISDEEFWEWQQAAKPRVDQDGLRVHGRIDLNAAPMSVLASIPLIPMAQIPPAFRPAVRRAAGLVTRDINVENDPLSVTDVEATRPSGHPVFDPPAADDAVRVWDGVAANVGDELARAIVAYRELREFVDPAPVPPGMAPSTLTGNYHFDRGWNIEDPVTGAPQPPNTRRGTGFLTVGELANVRHPLAVPEAVTGPGYQAPFMGYSAYRMDAGALGSPQADYLSAVALLVALSDWVTVRSHVYTVYGSVWGDPRQVDPQTDRPVAARELEARALRFQETVDRIPTFLGAPAPVRIGERFIARYNDLNDP